MDENPRAGDVGADDRDVPRSDDYEYDEAHDMPTGPVGAAAAPRPLYPPAMNLDAGGDYGYDEAHDLGR